MWCVFFWFSLKKAAQLRVPVPKSKQHTHPFGMLTLSQKKKNKKQRGGPKKRKEQKTKNTGRARARKGCTGSRPAQAGSFGVREDQFFQKAPKGRRRLFSLLPVLEEGFFRFGFLQKLSFWGFGSFLVGGLQKSLLLPHQGLERKQNENPGVLNPSYLWGRIPSKSGLNPTKRNWTPQWINRQTC